MKKLFLILLLSFITPFIYATDSAFYQATVSVASQAEEDVQTSMTTALAQVLVKVSGTDKILKSGKIKNQLNQASSYVQSYTFVPATDNPNNLQLQVQFYPQAINQLLQSAGARSIAKQRPNTVIWLASDSPQGKTLLNSNSNNDLTAALQNNATRRGLPIILPVMDLQDMQNISATDVWQLNPSNMAQATQRYGQANILEGKIYQSAKQQWNAEWLLLINGQQISDSAQGNDANAVIAMMINKVANTVTNKSVAPSNNGQQITLQVTNINGLDDYADILKYLRGLPMVNSVDVVNINASNLIVSIVINGDATTLINALNASTQLKNVPNTNPADSQTLVYRWVNSADMQNINPPVNPNIQSNNNNNPPDNGINMAS